MAKTRWVGATGPEVSRVASLSQSAMVNGVVKPAKVGGAISRRLSKLAAVLFLISCCLKLMMSRLGLIRFLVSEVKLDWPLVN